MNCLYYSGLFQLFWLFFVCLYMNLKIVFLSFYEELSRNFDEDCIKSGNCFWLEGHFHNICPTDPLESFHLLVFSLISFFSVSKGFYHRSLLLGQSYLQDFIVFLSFLPSFCCFLSFLPSFILFFIIFFIYILNVIPFPHFPSKNPLSHPPFPLLTNPHTPTASLSWHSPILGH